MGNSPGGVGTIRTVGTDIRDTKASLNRRIANGTITNAGFRLLSRDRKDMFCL